MQGLRFRCHALVLLIGLPLAAASAQQVTPQSPPPEPQPTTMPPTTTTTNQTQVPGFGDLDKAHRGYLNRSDIPKDVESLRDLRMHFNEADLNHDGRLTPDEYGAYTGPKAPGQAH